MSNSFKTIRSVLLLLIVIQNLISADQTISYTCPEYNTTNTNGATTNTAICEDPNFYLSYNSYDSYYVVDSCGKCTGMKSFINL